MTMHDARKLAPEAQKDLRRRVVAAVRRGMTKAEAARVFGVSRQSIHNWIRAVEGAGVEMISGVRSYLRSTQRQPEIVKKYFCADPVRYAAA